MADLKNNRLLTGSLFLSNVLNLIIIVLTIFHHFTMQDKIKKTEKFLGKQLLKL